MCLTHKDIVENKKKNKSTKRITNSHCRLLSNWLRTKKGYRELESIKAVKLNSYLAEFFLSVRKFDKNLPLNDPIQQYEPDAQLAMHSSFHRYLNSTNNGHNIKGSEVFCLSREVIVAKIKELKALGKGNYTKAS